MLAALGGRLSDNVALTACFVRDEDREPISCARAERLHAGPASTAERVAGPWTRGLLVEPTPIAVIPHDRFRVA